MPLIPWQSPAKGSAGEWSSSTPFSWDLCYVQHVLSWDTDQFLLGRSPSQPQPSGKLPFQWPQPSPLLDEPRGPAGSLLHSSQLCWELLVCGSGSHRDWVHSSLYTRTLRLHGSQSSLVCENSLQRDKVSPSWFAHGYTVKSKKWPKGTLLCLTSPGLRSSCPSMTQPELFTR